LEFFAQVICITPLNPGRMAVVVLSVGQNCMVNFVGFYRVVA